MYSNPEQFRNIIGYVRYKITLFRTGNHWPQESYMNHLFTCNLFEVKEEYIQD